MKVNLRKVELANQSLFKAHFMDSTRWFKSIGFAYVLSLVGDFKVSLMKNVIL